MATICPMLEPSWCPLDGSVCWGSSGPGTSPSSAGHPTPCTQQKLFSTQWLGEYAVCRLQCAAGFVLCAVFCGGCEVCSAEFAVCSTHVLLSRVLVGVVATAHVDHSYFQLPHPQPLVLTRANRVITNIWFEVSNWSITKSFTHFNFNLGLVNSNYCNDVWVDNPVFHWIRIDGWHDSYWRANNNFFK